MKDLDQKIIELMDLFDDEQVKTADQIKRPEKALEQQAIDDEEKMEKWSYNVINLDVMLINLPMNKCTYKVKED